ncbi:MAG: hypothetical protein ACJ8F3_13925 [Xanthobacteraceae bacterium]
MARGFAAGVLSAIAAIPVGEGAPVRGMAGQQPYPSLEALRKLEASFQNHLGDQHPWAAEDDDARDGPHQHTAHACLKPRLWSAFATFAKRRMRLMLFSPRVRRFAVLGGALGVLGLVAMGALWWRLSSGPIELDMATPWLAAAIKQNFGPAHEVDIGGTQLERDANGRTSLRIRDIIVRDADGTIVASAPKAEVGISGTGLLMGHIRAERLSLVGAEMALRIEHDSRLTVFAGANKRPFVTASASAAPITGSFTPSLPPSAAPLASVAGPSPSTTRGGVPEFAALLAWIESLDATGLDGGDLSEVGLKGGNLTLDDGRNGKQWTFANIDLSVTRPKGGGIAVMLGSEAGERPWLIRASMTPGQQGHRLIDIETQKVPLKDLMLAMRLGEAQFEPDLPMSGRMRADIGPDGMPHMLEGRILIEKGVVVDLDEVDLRIPIERAEVNLDWDAARRVLVMPFQVVSGGNRVTLLAQAEAPPEPGGAWGVKVSGGTVVLGLAQNDSSAVILDRFLLRLRVDPARQRVDIEPTEIGNTDLRVALEGSIDFSTDDPRLVLGIASSQVSVAAMKRVWPIFSATKVRTWVHEHVFAGTIQQLDISINAPWSTLRSTGPPVPDDGLLVQVAGHGAEIRPIEGLPPIRDADVSVRISGRSAVVNVGRANVEISPGRKLSITNGVFEVPDTFPKAPPAKARFRLDGSVSAAAELLALDRLRDHSGAPLDPGTSRGTLTAQMSLALPLKADLAPGSTTYTIQMDVANFAAERLVMNQKVEASALKVSANNNGYWIRGDVKLNGVAANLDYRKPRDADADVRVVAVLDENARGKLGFDLSSFLSGPVPVKVNGRVPREGESRLSVEADLTPAKVDNLLPGWTKAAGETARATFTMINKQAGTRLEDLVLDAPNTSVKGAIEVDSGGDVVSASFPVFSLSSRDRATLKADRTSEGTLRVTIRGDVYDGRNFIKSALGAAAPGKQKHDKDIDLDIKLGTVVGFHGETVRGFDLRMARRGSVITSLALNGKLGRDTPLVGDLRGRGGNGRQVIFVETNDAGAFFRFNDIYPKLFGGEMWVALDPQTAERAPQEGILNVRDFTVRGEPALERVAAAPQQAGQSPGVEFSRLRVEFTRSLGRFTIRDGLVKGPVIGATVDGFIDYHRDDVRMRGTFVPLYGLNNMFGQIPIFGQLLGGSNEGLLGVTYEVVGPTSAPVLRVNPISAIAPGLLRKFFEFPSSNSSVAPQSYTDPGRP